MMSVASKTKTKMFGSLAFGLVVVSVALPTWANTTPEFSSFSPSSPVVAVSQQQDLGELRSRLKTRFSGLSTELRSLVTSSSYFGTSGDQGAVRTLDVRQGIENVSSSVAQSYFVDIGNDPYASYINRLSAYGVLSSRQKFYPQNYFRVEDFTALFAKLYQKSTHQSLDFQKIVGIDAENGIMTKGILQQIMLAAKNITVLPVDGEPYDKLMRSEGAYYLVRMFDLPVLQLSSASLLAPAFSDTVGHYFAPAISTLASLDIVNTRTATFYPDNNLRHYDFVVLLVNTLLSVKSQTLSAPAYSSFADVEASASYLSQLAYASDRGLIDSLVVAKGGQFYFAPNDFVTKEQVYTILAKLAPLSFVYDSQLASTQKMTRGELAQLLVESFQLQALPSKTIESETNSTELSGENITLLNKLKVLLSMI